MKIKNLVFIGVLACLTGCSNPAFMSNLGLIISHGGGAVAGGMNSVSQQNINTRNLNSGNPYFRP